MNLLDFSSIFSGPENILWFVFGVLSVQVWQWVKAKYKNYKWPSGAPHGYKKINWLYVSIALTFMITTFIGVQNQLTYEYAKRLAQNVRSCQIEFNSALKARSDITDQDRALNAQWQKTTLKAIGAISNMPPAIAHAPIGSPAMADYEDKIFDQYFSEITEIELQRRVNEQIRSQIQLPEPGCGREEPKLDQK